MTFFKLVSFFGLITLSLFSSLLAQGWVSYQSQQQINDLVETDTELLMATDAGLVVINKLTLEKTIFNQANSNLRNNHIPAITQAPNGNFWIGTYDVILQRFDGSNFDDPIVPLHPEYNASATKLYDLKIAPNGDLWVGTTDGVFQQQDQNWAFYGQEELGPTFFEAWDIAINDEGDVFVASFDVHQLSNGTWSNLTEGTQVHGYLHGSLFFSQSGDLFFAGDLEEIGRYDGVQWQAHPHGLNGSQIKGFTEDVNGNTPNVSRWGWL